MTQSKYFIKNFGGTKIITETWTLGASEIKRMPSVRRAEDSYTIVNASTTKCTYVIFYLLYNRIIKAQLK